MLVFDHVSKCFGDLRAVDDLSFELEAGEVFGLLGPNGAGKTTAINMAVGLLEPDEGVVRFADEAFDRNPRDAENRRSLGLAPQSIALYEQISGADNLRFFGRLHGLRGRSSSASNSSGTEASRSSTPPTTWKRPSVSATGSQSSITAG